MSGTWLSQKEALAELPREAEVVVVGGGLIGCALAYYLARSDQDVVLVERNELNREASGRNAGSFHFQIAIHQLTGQNVGADSDRLRTEIELYVEAAELWAGLEVELQGSVGLHRTGGLMVAESDEDLALLVAKQDIERAAGLETHVLYGDQIREVAPSLAADLAGATFCPAEGHANPLLAAPLYALRAAQVGAAIRTHAPVAAIAATPGGGFSVSTARGTIRAAKVINAAGAWTNEIARLLGARHPVRCDGLHVNVTERRERILVPMVQHIGRRLTLKQASNGSFLIGGGWPAVSTAQVGRYRTTWKSAAGNLAVAVRVLPALSEVRLLRTWTGALAFTDDLSPLVGPSHAIPGYFTCMATTGFTLGPLMARRLAEQIVSPGVNTVPEEYGPDRRSTSQQAETQRKRI